LAVLSRCAHRRGLLPTLLLRILLDTDDTESGRRED
jgi:hypothetical protein